MGRPHRGVAHFFFATGALLLALVGFGPARPASASPSRAAATGSTAYQYKTQWGSLLPGQLREPYDVAVDSKGNVYVADASNNRVQKFNATGASLLQFGTLGSADGQMWSPTGIAIDGNDNVYITDANNDRVEEFDASGQFVRKWGSYGTGDGQFDGPIGIAVDAQGFVYVVDSYNNRIEKSSPRLAAFWRSGEWPEPESANSIRRRASRSMVPETSSSSIRETTGSKRLTRLAATQVPGAPTVAATVNFLSRGVSLSTGTGTCSSPTV